MRSAVKVIAVPYDWSTSEPPGSPVSDRASLEVMRWWLRRGTIRVDRAMERRR